MIVTIIIIDWKGWQLVVKMIKNNYKWQLVTYNHKLNCCII
jgi:hypothetical protein